VRFTTPALTEGVHRHRIEGIEVAITDPARTIVDCFRYRAKVGIDIAMEGLREGLRQRKATSDQLR
jgi:predicted transcriptional regulator of viral defense system